MIFKYFIEMFAGEIGAWPDQPDEIPEMHFPSSDEGAGQIYICLCLRSLAITIT